MTYEQALRICAEAHKEAGQSDIAEIFTEAADNEAQRKLQGYAKLEQDFRDWLRSRPDVIIT